MFKHAASSLTSRHVHRLRKIDSCSRVLRMYAGAVKAWWSKQLGQAETSSQDCCQIEAFHSFYGPEGGAATCNGIMHCLI